LARFPIKLHHYLPFVAIDKLAYKNKR
jgi:hypothetical protein